MKDRRIAVAVVACGVVLIGAGCGGTKPKADESPTPGDARSTSSGGSGSERAAPSAPDGSDKVWTAPKDCPDLAAFGDINGHTTPENDASLVEDGTATLRCGDYPLIGNHGEFSASVFADTRTPAELLKEARDFTQELGAEDYVVSDTDVDMPELGAGAVRRELVPKGAFGPTCGLYVPTNGGTLFVEAAARSEGATMKSSCDEAMEILNAIS